MTTLALLALVPLLVWRIYSRLKRMLARQKSQLWRHWAAALLLPALLVSLAVSMAGDLLAVSCLAAGALAGAWLGMWGIRLTRFESTQRGYFFTPNLRLGITISLLFAARVLYRGMELYMNSRTESPHPLTNQDFIQSPFTTLSFGLLAGYFATYAIGLIRWRRSQKPLPEPQ